MANTAKRISMMPPQGSKAQYIVNIGTPPPPAARKKAESKYPISTMTVGSWFEADGSPPRRWYVMKLASNYSRNNGGKYKYRSWVSTTNPYRFVVQRIA